MPGAKPNPSPIEIARPAVMLVLNSEAEVRQLVENAIPERRRPRLSLAFSDNSTPLVADPAPDVVLINLTREGHSYLSRLSNVRALWPRAQVIFLSPLDDIHLWAEAVRLGAYDFLPKSSDRIS